MTIPTDLHPDDAANRRRMFAELQRLRETAGLSKEDVGGRMGVSADSIRRVEALADPRNPSPPNSLLMTVQRQARALDHVAIPTLHGIEAPPVTAYMRMLEHLTYSVRKPELADAALRALTIETLAEVRKAQRPKVSVRMFSLASGLKEKSIFKIETLEHDPLISSYQRYARGLGGWMTVEFQPIELVDLDELKAAA